MNKTFTQKDPIQFVNDEKQFLISSDYKLICNFLEYQDIIEQINETLICPSDASIKKILEHSSNSKKVVNNFYNLN